MAISEAGTIATFAVGLAITESPDAGKPVPVPCNKIAEAFHFLSQSQKYREDWVDKQYPKDEEEEQEQEEGDPIVNEVRKAADLSKHEEGLLGCIVDPSKSQTRSPWYIIFNLHSQQHCLLRSMTFALICTSKTRSGA